MTLNLTPDQAGLLVQAIESQLRHCFPDITGPGYLAINRAMQIADMAQRIDLAKNAPSAPPPPMTPPTPTAAPPVEPPTPSAPSPDQPAPEPAPPL